MANVVLSPTQCIKLKTWTMLAAAAVQIPNTGSTSENILATIALAAGAMGPNGALRIWCLWSCNNSAGTKTLRARLGGAAGTVFYQSARSATVISEQFLSLVRNRNNAASQVGMPLGNTGYGPGNAVPFTMAVNTAVAQDIVLTGQLSVGTDNLNLEAYQAEVYYGA